jgi:hypothetical protein
MSVCIHSDKNNSLTQDLLGSATLADRWGSCVRDGGAILIEHRGCRAIIRSARPWSFLPVSSQKGRDVDCQFAPFPLLLFLP